jgi:hypothetical protein
VPQYLLNSPLILGDRILCDRYREYKIEIFISSGHFILAQSQTKFPKSLAYRDLLKLGETKGQFYPIIAMTLTELG